MVKKPDTETVRAIFRLHGYSVDSQNNPTVARILKDLLDQGYLKESYFIAHATTRLKGLELVRNHFVNTYHSTLPEQEFMMVLNTIDFLAVMVSAVENDGMGFPPSQVFAFVYESLQEGTTGTDKEV
jgi:hypothetical protein